MQKKLKKKRRRKVKYNEKYDLYLDDDFVIYYWNKKLDKLMQRQFIKDKNGYLLVRTKLGTKRVHRVIYETFVGPIPPCYEIDHIDTHKDNNSLSNLKCVTHTENMNNPKTKQKMIGNIYAKGKPTSEFGRKFKEHYGITRYQNIKLYDKELHWFRYNGKCRWEE